MGKLVKITEENGILLIGINRASKKNCVNHETARELVTAFEKFNNTDDLKCAILYGEGGTFCAGYDLEEVSTGGFTKIESEFLEKYRYMGPSIMPIKKPLIAAIEGYAVAGGLELSLMADLRVCSKSSKMGVFCRRVGVPLIDGGTVRLPRVVGLGRALDLILTGREIGAIEAKEWGLVNRVAEDGKALDEAIKLAELIRSHPELCMLADRESTYHSLDHSTQDAFDFEFQSVKVLPDSIKGAKNFIKKSKL
ncbi:unnamed protein product [Caenorhabditis angaria]|uniref:Uncharacterized protein n=1 Tax=Caenorhabditis angaria TaxID=860376 RepID=A0A9P1N4X4_9PELO|nr:unnamed protein product [Caenorhabditis angaria]